MKTEELVSESLDALNKQLAAQNLEPLSLREAIIFSWLATPAFVIAQRLEEGPAAAPAKPTRAPFPGLIPQ